MTKIVGTDYLGNDEEVISKIMVTDEEEELRATLLAHSTAWFGQGIQFLGV